jgi:hypothetical protein
MILPLALGVGMFVFTLCMQAVPIEILLRIAASKRPRRLIHPSFGANFIELLLVAGLILLLHLVNIALWAVLYWLCGEFAELELAFYHSAVNYSSLGYGDIVMSLRWRLLGPLEAIDGTVMFGISTALIVALTARLIERRVKAKEIEIADASKLPGDLP